MASNQPEQRSGLITALRIHERDPQRVHLFLDETFALTISVDTVVGEQLYIGRHLSLAEYARLSGLAEADHAYRLALRALESRARSVGELQERLRRKGMAQAAIEQAIERLRNLGLVDDLAFAQSWIDGRQRSRPRGPAALRDELRRKGVAAATIDTAIAAAGVADTEYEQALHLARRMVDRYAALADFAVFSRKLGGMLQRRGFSYDVVRPIVTLLWQELNGTTTRDSDDVICQ
ncbi:MAG TPA: RecX family transcriptional regulator [Roseiflexaceae bacterium]|nr:RecX family transcriptional regulator [Roseiflexaceae bacterium]HMP39043.1 RecX family transcriptional regulator [Roseiflexaceae bacterium]